MDSSGTSNGHHAERRRLLEQVTSARTVDEILAARCALRRWMRRHPEDETVGAAFSRLAIAELHAS